MLAWTIHLCYVVMVRSRLLVLGLLLVGSAVSVIVYQLSNNSEVQTKILPSHPLLREIGSIKNPRGRVAWDDLGDTPDADGLQYHQNEVGRQDDGTLARDELLPTVDGPEDGNLQRLGTSDTARALRQQAIANRKQAAKLHAQQKRLTGDIFKFKIEKSRQEGLRKRLEEDLENLKQEKRVMQEERKEFALERIYHRPNSEGRSMAGARVNGLNTKNTQKTSAEHPGQPHRRNPLSAQGAGLKRYLKQMKRNFKSKDRSSTNFTVLPLVGDGRRTLKREGTLLHEVAFPGGGGVVMPPGGDVEPPGGALGKLPLIEEIVQQGHFGYEHGRNGKASSQQKAEGGQSTAEGSPTSNEALQRVPEPRVDLNDMWEGHDPAQVVRQWHGIMLDGDYMLRSFIDITDKRASGMEGSPQSIDYMSEGAAEERFYQLVTVDHMHCGDIERMGNHGDGGWDMCVAAPYKPSRDCLVYSFGINNDFSFDDGISNKYGCEVKAFDPSMNVGDHMHSSKVHFFNLGLGAADGINNQAWQLRTFGSILKRLGHSNHVIDFLKVDIEFNEWACLHTALAEQSLRNIKQLVFEIHTSEVYTVNTPSHKENFLKWYNVLLGLEKQGFRRYHHHFNPSGQYTSVRTGKDRTCCYELYYINIRFLK